MAGRIARSCIACGARTPDGSSRCPQHQTGGIRPRRCAECGAPTTGADYCPTHTHPDSRPTSWRHAYRDPAWARNKRAALRRDEGRCVQCHLGIPDGIPVQVDHITPLSAHGTNDLDNLQTLCSTTPGREGCHQKKTRGAR